MMPQMLRRRRRGAMCDAVGGARRLAGNDPHVPGPHSYAPRHTLVHTPTQIILQQLAAAAAIAICDYSSCMIYAMMTDRTHYKATH